MKKFLHSYKITIFLFTISNLFASRKNTKLQTIHESENPSNVHEQRFPRKKQVNTKSRTNSPPIIRTYPFNENLTNEFLIVHSLFLVLRSMPEFLYFIQKSSFKDPIINKLIKRIFFRKIAESAIDESIKKLTENYFFITKMHETLSHDSFMNIFRNFLHFLNNNLHEGNDLSSQYFSNINNMFKLTISHSWKGLNGKLYTNYIYEFGNNDHVYFNEHGELKIKTFSEKELNAESNTYKYEISNYPTYLFYNIKSDIHSILSKLQDKNGILRDVNFCGKWYQIVGLLQVNSVLPVLSYYVTSRPEFSIRKECENIDVNIQRENVEIEYDKTGILLLKFK